ncbi:unnamed protein product, partial [Medioppia subpectinata]
MNAAHISYNMKIVFMCKRLAVSENKFLNSCEFMQKTGSHQLNESWLFLRQKSGEKYVDCIEKLKLVVIFHLNHRVKSYERGAQIGCNDEVNIIFCPLHTLSIVQTCGPMYKKLQREHLLLQRSFASVSQSLNENLSKCQSNEQFISNIVHNKSNKTKCQLKRQLKNVFLNIPSVPVIIHKKLCKEHVILQQSFATVCQSLREMLERDGSQRPKQHNISNSQQKKSNKKEFDELRRRIELLSIELQETRDQNELLEFRIHEFEHIKAPKNQTSNKSSFNAKADDFSHRFNLRVYKRWENRRCVKNNHYCYRQQVLRQTCELPEIPCNKCCKLETQLFDVNNENQKLNEKFNATQKTLNELIAKYALKEELNNLLLQRNYTKNTVIDKNSYIGSAMTSEDEGLGDDTRRDHSSGPSSLVDSQEPEYDVMSESTQSTPDLGHKEGLTNACSIEDVEQLGPQREQLRESVESDKDKEQYLRLEVMRSNDLIEKLKQSIDKLKGEKAILEEQVLELEEAENDSRLMSQRLQQQMQTFVDDYEKLELDLINANKTIDLNNNRIKKTDLRHQIEEMRNKRCEQHSTQVDSLYSVVWERLYRLENQIDCLKQSYNQTNQTNCSQDYTDDDLQLFISAERLSEGVSKIGSSFEVSHFDKSRDQAFNHCEASVRLDDLVLSMPLCEAVKAERIDVMVPNTSQLKVTPSPSHALPHELTTKLAKLETNEQQLRERLVQLEWINKEFVRELELREKIFFEREKNQNEWTNSENEFKYAINELKNEIKTFDIRNAYERRIKILLEEHKLMEKELKMKMKEMEGQTSSTVNQLEFERNKIIKQLEENKIEAKILQLVKNKSNCDKLRNCENEKLKIEINCIQSCEEELKRKLNEMMQKESAYVETLAEADKIIATLEHNYKHRIEELEASKTGLKLRVTQLEESESRLRSSLRPDRRATNDSYGKASDLVKQLIDSEARECSLRQQIKALETSVNQLNQQLEDTNHLKQRIETELKDQDELVST